MTDSVIHELLIDPYPIGSPAGTLAAVLQEPGNQNARCLAAWTSEYGAINRLVTLWERVDGHCLTSGSPMESIDWLSPIRMGWQLDPQVELCTDYLSAPFVDLRFYSIKPGKREEILATFVENLTAREKYSPCAGMWAAKERDRDLMVHLWPYESFEQRMAVREETFRDADWLQYLIRAADAFEHFQVIQLLPCPLPEGRDDKVASD